MIVQPLARRSFLAMAAASVAAASRPAQARARLPEAADTGLWRSVSFEDRDGRTFQLGSGPSLTLVTMWAHWCPACLSEMPSLTALSAALGAQLEVLLVSHPEYWAQDQAMAQRRHIPHRMATLSSYNAPGTLEAALLQDGAYSVPRSLLFRRDATVAWSHLGSMDWASADAIGRVRALA